MDKRTQTDEQTGRVISIYPQNLVCVEYNISTYPELIKIVFENTQNVTLSQSNRFTVLKAMTFV